MLLKLANPRGALRCCVLSYALSLLVVLPATAGTITGVVRNTTTGQVAPGQNVVLLDMQSNMETLVTARTDAQGRFRIEHAAIGRGPVLVRVQYQGVNYHTNVPPGREAADVEIFEATTDASLLNIATRMVVVQPDGASLLVGEEYTIHNHSKPPQAFFRPDGTFEFVLPEGATLAQASAWGPSGLPLVQGTLDRGAQRSAIAFPVRPGENGVRLSYSVAYAQNQATLRLTSPYAATRIVLIAPPTLTVSGGGFAPAGSEQGWSLYSREGSAANAVIEFSISGTAPPPSQQEPASPNSATPTGTQVQVVPGRLDDLKWILVLGFAALFVLGGLFLWKRPVPTMATAPNVAASVAGGPSDGEPARRAAPQMRGAAADVEHEVRLSLDELKDALFRLELRRQAGTISEEEYSRERSRMEKTLRELLRG